MRAWRPVASRPTTKPPISPALTVDLATSFRATIARAGLELSVECPPLPEAVYVDRDMWEKIVLNLLSNAFKFTFSGTISVRFVRAGRVRCAGGDGYRNRHWGAGSVAAVRALSRVEGVRSRSHEGSGIGLAFVRELTRMHRGEVLVESVVGEGTTFTVRIPSGSAHLPKEQLLSQEVVESITTNVPSFVEEARSWDTVRRPSRPSRPPVALATGHGKRSRALAICRRQR